MSKDIYSGRVEVPKDGDSLGEFTIYSLEKDMTEKTILLNTFQRDLNTLIMQIKVLKGRGSVSKKQEKKIEKYLQKIKNLIIKSREDFEWIFTKRINKGVD